MGGTAQSGPNTMGFGHVATLTPDLDRYVRFYQDIFEARVVSTMEAHDDHPRMAIVDVGAMAMLNVFEVPEQSIVGERDRMGGRGPIDHFALSVGSRQAFESLRDRLVEVGASPGDVTDFGPFVHSVFFRDPDGAELELTYDDRAAAS
jgi:catechol 2,3-dioxygenase-like lactoylglutathione lyase family enzyme